MLGQIRLVEIVSAIPIYNQIEQNVQFNITL